VIRNEETLNAEQEPWLPFGNERIVGKIIIPSIDRFIRDAMHYSTHGAQCQACKENRVPCIPCYSTWLTFMVAERS
jgi:hypothetical protein